ncbi:hypothetical protein KDAU_34860 [Dictyobacter aurantiacus]|uniref:Peptidase S53 domain-containing protein n=1 Tax=Dictyobacter aurantiacus TaxID=1936993 RepID=A0A401ZH13_9CHLR|nr:hypothetical protein KDAU_34860 [Dictyobacter aurantiacus]
MDSLLAAQNDPTSPLYHHYLTTEEFNAQFAPTQDDWNAVAKYARGQGFKVTEDGKDRTTNHLIVNASGTVEMANKAFGITIQNYNLKGRIVYQPNHDPLVPKSVYSLIKNVTGLNNVGTYHRLDQQHRLRQAHPRQGPISGYTPNDLRAAYDINPLLQAKNNGKGQTIALFEMDGYNQKDIDIYRQHYGLGALKPDEVLVDGATNTAGAGAIEVELDMEVASAIAPGAAQWVYIGPNTVTGVENTYNRIVSDNKAKIVSISWGECELTSTAAQMRDTLNTIFKQGTAQGQMFFAASGDSGAYDCDNTINNPTTVSVDTPASDPNVIGVGGTTLHTGPNGSYGSESAWNGTTGQGGGGFSARFPRPDYQKTLNPPGINPLPLQRFVPDVSANADGNPGYSIYYTSGNTTNPGWTAVGGTSAAAPLWAGIAADIAQMLQAKNPPALSQFNKTLYTLYNQPQSYIPFHDITTGTNGYYPADKGYDLATGLGSPDAWNIARDLQSDPVSNVRTLLTKNTSFEDKSVDWKETSSGGYELVSVNNPHIGLYSAYLCGYINCHDTISQTVQIPRATSQVTLSYWVDIVDPEPTNKFRVLLQTTQGKLIKTVRELQTANGNGWIQYTDDVSDALKPYAGKSIQIVFDASGSSTPQSPFAVNLDDVSLQQVSDTSGNTTQMMKKPSFDQGKTPWQQSSKGGLQLINKNFPRTPDTYSAYMCNYPNCQDSVAQTVTLPATTRNIILSYWVYLGRSNTTGACSNTFRSYVREPGSGGRTIASIQKLCSTDANGWMQYSFNLNSTLMSYAGKPIQFVFETSAQTNGRTNFYVSLDDVLLYVTR